MADDKIDDAHQSESTDDVSKNALLAQAKKLLDEGKIEDSLKLVKGYWLENPDDAEAADLFSELMKESGRSELSKRLHTLAEQLPSMSHPVDSQSLSMADSQHDEFDDEDEDLIEKEKPQAELAPPGGKEFFEAGYSLIDARQHELAAMLLNRAARMAPEEPTVNYELGFALMSMKRFEQAIPHLEQALDQAADFDTLLNLLVCYTLTRQLGKAHGMLAKMNSVSLDAEQKKEFRTVFRY